MKLHKNNNRAKLFLLLMFIVSFNIFSTEKIVVRLDNPDEKTADKFISANYDVASYFPGKHLDLIIENSAFENLQNLYPQARIVKTELQVKDDLRSKKDIAGYRSYAQTLAELQQIASDNPGICKLYNIGNSQGNIYSESGLSSYDNFNHNIWALKISDNVEVEEDEPSFFFLGGHHAREPIGTEMVMTILNDLLAKYSSDPAAQKRINDSQIWFVPVVNPDGQKVVLTEADVWWRKNIRDNNGDEYFSFTGDGVDLNRNYGFWWGPNGTSHDPSEDVYNGPEAWSEPEVRAVRDLIDSHKFVAGITFHSYSELVLYPMGYDADATAPDKNSLRSLAESIAYSIPSQGSGTYYPCQSTELYPTMGSTDDYAYGEHGVFCYTIEMAQEFIPSWSEMRTICDNSLESASILLDRANSSMLTGIVSGGITKNPVQAEIFVSGVSDTGSYKKPYVSSGTYGRYYRFLEPGTYDVTISAFGYISQTIPGVIISSAGITDLDVTLTSSDVQNFSVFVSDSLTGYPVQFAKIGITEAVQAVTDEAGYYHFNNIPCDDYVFSVTAENYETSYFPVSLGSGSDTLNFHLNRGNIEDFETRDFSRYPWSFSGNTDWYISSYLPHKGDFYARSGLIDNSNGTSTLVLNNTISEDGNISFFLKTSGVKTGDIFRFLIDGDIIKTWYNARWIQAAFPVTRGSHTFAWQFYKNSEYGGDHYASVDNIRFPVTGTTGINDELSSVSSGFTLEQSYPNPFNPSTEINFSLKESGIVKLNVYNVKGEFVSSLINCKMETGSHRIIFDARNLISGIYFISLEAGNSRITRSALLIK